MWDSTPNSAWSGTIASGEKNSSTATTLGPASTGNARDRKSTRLNSSHDQISYAVFCLKKKNCLGVERQDLCLDRSHLEHALVRRHAPVGRAAAEHGHQPNLGLVGAQVASGRRVDRIYACARR